MNWKKSSVGLWVLLFGLCSNQYMSAQQISLESSVYYGKVWRHTPKLKTQSGEGLLGQELAIRVQTLGKRDWQAWQRYPSLGACLAHFELGKGSHNRAFGLLPWLNVPVLSSNWLRINFRLGTGLAWVSNPYDWWNNPDQNAIGSHWNNMTQFRLGAEAVLSSRVRLIAGGSFTHFSNGGVSLPNYGVNVISGWLGACWAFKQASREDYKPALSSRKKGYRKFGGLLQGGYASAQIATLDGPKYPIWLGSGSLFYQFNRLHRASIGLDYEQNSAIYTWSLHSALFNNESAAKKGSTRLSVFIGEEFLFGDLSIQLQAGKYLGKNVNAFVPKKLYSKLSLRWYAPEQIKLPLRPFIGVTLKAHAFTAEYIAWNIGMSF